MTYNWKLLPPLGTGGQPLKVGDVVRDHGALQVGDGGFATPAEARADFSRANGSRLGTMVICDENDVVVEPPSHGPRST